MRKINQFNPPTDSTLINNRIAPRINNRLGLVKNQDCQQTKRNIMDKNPNNTKQIWDWKRNKITPQINKGIVFVNEKNGLWCQNAKTNTKTLVIRMHA